MKKILTEDQKKRKSELARSKREKAKAEGLCSSCQSALKLTGYKQCQSCIDHNFFKYLFMRSKVNWPERSRNWQNAHPTWQRNYYENHKEEFKIRKRKWKTGFRARLPIEKRLERISRTCALG